MIKHNFIGRFGEDFRDVLGIFRKNENWAGKGWKAENYD